MRQVSEMEKGRFTHLYERGLTYTQIADLTGWSHSVIRLYSRAEPRAPGKRPGHGRRRPSATPARLAWLYRRGWTLAEIAEITGWSESSVRDRVRPLVELRRCGPRGAVKDLERRARRLAAMVARRKAWGDL